MARKRTEHGHDVDAYLAGAVRRSESSARVAQATGLSQRTVERRMAEIKAKGGALLPRTAEPPPSAQEPAGETLVVPVPDEPAAVADNAPATAKDRQVDALLANSLVWRRVQAAIVGALAVHPLAAAAVVRALRAVQL